MIQKKYGQEFCVKSSKIKSCLENYFGEKISFVYPKQKNRSVLFHGRNVSDAIENYYYRDVLSESAEILSQSFKQINFNLKDRFCDEADLHSSWENMEVPEPILLFFAKLFSIDKNEILNNKFELENEENTIQTCTKIKLLRVKSLIPTIHYINSGGRQRTPMHCLLGLSTYSKTKSKSTITALNRLALSISYDDVLRIRFRLAAYAKINSENKVPLPSHFSPSSYVTAAFDNFDHNEATTSGLNSTHDTVAVLFQDLHKNYNKKKPKVSETLIDCSARSFSTILPFQKIQQFEKLSSIISFSENDIFSDEIINLTAEQYQNDLQIDDFAWFLCRMSILDEKIELQNEKQYFPTWSLFNSIITSDQRVKQIVGFLPILPHPVTEYPTVYTALCNFKNILEQLNQKNLPVACDEGVYRIARHIILKNKEEFKDITLFLGNFHIIKLLLSCIGKYLEGSGAEVIFIESGLFGAL